MSNTETLILQGKLPFSIRKTRSGSKKAAAIHSENCTPYEKNATTPRKTSSKSGVQCSPEKRMRTNENDGFVGSPSKNRNNQFEDALSRKPLSPIKLISENILKENEILSPKKSLFNQEVNAYRETKSVLSATANSELFCRDKEISHIDCFINGLLETNKAGCLYISGAPGTGKTACMEKIYEALDGKCSRAFVNCTSLNNPQGVYDAIWSELNKSNANVSRNCGQDINKALEEKLTNSKRSVLIVLDELDYLENKANGILYTIFRWPAMKNSKVILIGLANALDLTSRVLPHLHILKYRPSLLHFEPYTKDQISTILQARLKAVSSQVVISPVAVEFCSRKVASVAGDLRKALDVCRRAVELVEAEIYKQRKLKSIDAVEENASIIKRVELPMVVSILNDVYGNSLANRNQSDENSLPLQQRVLLCTLLLIVKHAKSKEITLGKFSDIYSRVCLQHQVSKVDQAEFVSICHLVEARGLLHIKYHRQIRQSMVSLRVNEAEIEFALQDKLLLASILTDSAHIMQKK